MTRLALSILSDDEILFSRLRKLAGSWAIFRVAGIHAIDGLPAQNLVLIDTATKGLSERTPQAWQTLCQKNRLITLSSQPNDEEGLAWLELGAVGYCHAYASEDTLLQVLTVVSSGEIWVGRNLMNRLLKGVGSHRSIHGEDWASRLTEREQQIAKIAANGESNQAIAQSLGITERTVKSHLTAIFEKLAVNDRLQLALKVHGIR